LATAASTTLIITGRDVDAGAVAFDVGNDRLVGHVQHRKEMPDARRHVVCFEQPGVQCFWMRNTLLPLTAAFVDDDGTIVNLADMKPQTTDSHCSTKPVRYVLEMNQGWFGKRASRLASSWAGARFRSVDATVRYYL
jgi:uncharacterized membrane protein (UPF0127 family)